jgi:hypothetical protein
MILNVGGPEKGRFNVVPEKDLFIRSGTLLKTCKIFYFILLLK